MKIEDIGSPSKVINGFHPELFGKPLEVRKFLCSCHILQLVTCPAPCNMQENSLVASDTLKGPDGLTYYHWCVRLAATLTAPAS